MVFPRRNEFSRYNYTHIHTAVHYCFFFTSDDNPSHGLALLLALAHFFLSYAWISWIILYAFRSTLY